MNYATLCSGIEAPTVAWAPLGWRPLFFSEIEPFPSAMLAHHYPDTPNLGDMEDIDGKNLDESVDLICAGTPCQDFSVAGKRAGMDGARGHLTRVFLELLGKLRPAWVVWENVYGVLSSNGGRDFGVVLGTLGQLGYGLAYRTLDAQYVRVDGFGRAVPQRRRRVFVVGSLGDWRRAAAVLFERESLCGNPAPSRGQGKEVAGTLGGGSGERGWDSSLDTAGALVVDTTQITSPGNYSNPRPGDPCHPLAASARPPVVAIQEVSSPHREKRQKGMGVNEDGAMYTLLAGEQHGVGCFKPGQGAKSRSIGYSEDVAPTLESAEGGNNKPAVHQGMVVRRLTPREYERLQGFPDDYTLIPYRKGLAKDSPRYRAVGNSMPVNAMRWIGRRMQMLEAITENKEMRK